MSRGSSSLRRLQDVAASVRRRAFDDEVKERRVLFGIARGSRLPLNVHESVRMWLGLYEIEIARYLRALITKDARCFDLGAGDGYYTLALARLAPAGTVVAVEADQALCQRLRTTVRRNGVNTRVEVVEGEVSPTGVTIDSLARMKGSPSLIKMDIEGAEAEAMLGAREVLHGPRPCFIIETHGVTADSVVTQSLADADYQVRVVEQQRLWPDRRPIELNRWLIATAAELEQRAHRGPTTTLGRHHGE